MFSIRLVVQVTLVIALALPQLYAQPMRAPTGKEKALELLTYEPETENFKKALTAMREQMKSMRAAEINYHNSETKEEERKIQSQWFEIRQQTHGLHLNLITAALEEYLADTQGKAALGAIIFKSLKRNADKDNFEGMLPIAKGLFDAKFPAPELPQIYTQCCLANNEFELAKTALSAARHPQALLDEMTQQLDVMAKDWEEEKVARERDAAGEPLPQAKFITTKGEIIVELFENDAPEAVASFISLAESGFYEYKDFFMVIDHLAAQTGCPNEDGTGGPGYMLKDEFEIPSARKLFRGSLVLALLRNHPNSGGSQFYITFLPVMSPEQKQTVFGRVISGMQNVSNLNRVDPSKKKEGEEKEEKEPKLPADEIVRIEILRKRNHPYEPTRLPLKGQGTVETSN